MRSAVPASGWSSASGAAATHSLQRPESDRTRNRTVPEPCQCRPTRLKRSGAAAEASDRVGVEGQHVALRDRRLLAPRGGREDGGEQGYEGEKPHGEAT